MIRDELIKAMACAHIDAFERCPGTGAGWFADAEKGTGEPEALETLREILTDELACQAAVLPVVVRAITGQVRTLHEPVDMLHMPTNRVVTVCLACGTDAGERLHPCPTVRLCDEIDAWAGVQR